MLESNNKVLIIDDEPFVRESIAEYLDDEGFPTETAKDATDAREKLQQENYSAILLDIRMPGMDGMTFLVELLKTHPSLPVIMVSGHGTMQIAIEALRLGAHDFLTNPINLDQFTSILNQVITTTERQVKKPKLPRPGELFKTVSLPSAEGSFIGESPWAKKVRNQIRLLIEAKCETILITGETGTGKDVLARAIHDGFGDSKEPFIAVSCPALPDSLVESELFGHAKGAFTGATDERVGCFEMANGGTLFLDEIGDLSLVAQAKILRALETRTVRRVGSSKEIPIHLRVIAATNLELNDAIKDGRFRSDLYYRLNMFAIKTLPLKDRLQDVVPMANHFLQTFATRRGWTNYGFTPDAQEALCSYRYPGNVRELKNIVERAAILYGDTPIYAEHLEFSESNSLVPPAVFNHESASEPNCDEKKRIESALHQTKWNRRAAAALLGMPYSTLRYKIEKLNIK